MTAPQAKALDDCRTGSQRLAQVELFFGGRGQGAERNAWKAFLARVVTPRFPQGLAILRGNGQWQGPHGVTQDSARVMIIIYKPDRTSDARIEAIRASYKTRFKQQSVLRIDTMVCASF